MTEKVEISGKFNLLKWAEVDLQDLKAQKNTSGRLDSLVTGILFGLIPFPRRLLSFIWSILMTNVTMLLALVVVNVTGILALLGLIAGTIVFVVASFFGYASIVLTPKTTKDAVQRYVQHMIRQYEKANDVTVTGIEINKVSPLDKEEEVTIDASVMSSSREQENHI